MRAIILVGGEGTRLRPLTLNLPKPIVPLVNKPLLEYQLELLKRHGIREVIFAVGYKPDLIKAVFGDGSKMGMQIFYAIESKPLGTGGAIKNAEKFIHGPTIIFNGDVFTDLDLTVLTKFHHKKKAMATIVLNKIEDPTSYGVVETSPFRRIRRFLEKPSWAEARSNWINAGTYLFEPEVFSLMPEKTVYSVERELFPLLLKQKERFYAYPYKGYWLDIGKPENYLQANMDILEKRVSTGLTMGRNGIKIGKKTSVAKDAKLVGPLAIAETCKIDSGVHVERCVIGRSSHVKKRALLHESVLWENVRIDEEAILRGCIVGSRCHIGAFAQLREGTVLGEGTTIAPHSKI